MAVTDVHRPGTVYWIDHHVVGTNDMATWVDWAINVIGVTPSRIGGLTTEEWKAHRQVSYFAHLREPCHIGAFLQKEQLPPSRGLGIELPRYGFFVRPEDIDEHLRRLDQFNVVHSDPMRTSEFGEDGTVIYFEDPDQNQWEFWAPDKMVPGAMDGCGPLKVGHISGAVFGARELVRNADFFSTFCGLDPSRSAEVENNALVLPLAGGGRIVYKKVDELENRTLGHAPWNPPHTALVIREEEFFSQYKLLWSKLPEWDGHDPLDTSRPVGNEEDLPARTGLHGSPDGRRFKKIYGRGDEFYDWETHAFHFVGGVPKATDMALYDGRYMEDYLKTYTAGAAGI